MKKIILYIGLAVFLLTSCEQMPYAEFSASNDDIYVGEAVYFDNYSDYSYDYHWDFGDGYYSVVKNPVHSYSAPGTYRVTLTAYGHEDSYDEAHVYITVTGDATLEVTVMEWRENPSEKYFISNAEVTLYTNEDDFYNWRNPIVTATTNINGVVVFTGLQDRPYYIDVYNNQYNNNQLYFDDIDFVRTAPLVRGALNTFVAYVDYDPVQKKSTQRERANNEKLAKDRKYPKPE